MTREIRSMMTHAFRSLETGCTQHAIDWFEEASYERMLENDLPNTPMQRFLFKLHACLESREEIGAMTLNELAKHYSLPPSYIGWLALEMQCRDMLIDSHAFWDEEMSDFNIGCDILKDSTQRQMLVESIRKQLC